MENINEHDMTKKMLDTIRNGNTPNSLNENVQNIKPSGTNKQLEQLDEHDMTKKMLGAINEFRDAPQLDLGGGTTKSTEDVVKVEDDKLGEEASRLRSMVGGVDLKLYEVYPKDQNVVMVGVLDNGIEFKFSKKEGAPYINVDNMRLDSETVDSIKKLQAYYINWIEGWAEDIGEYIQSV